FEKSSLSTSRQGAKVIAGGRASSACLCCSTVPCARIWAEAPNKSAAHMTPLIAAALLAAPNRAPGIEQDFDVALGLAGLTRATAGWDEGILGFYRQSDKPASLYTQCYQDPWRTPFYMDMLRRQATVAVGHGSSLVELASRSLGEGTRRSLLADPAQPYL